MLAADPKMVTADQSDQEASAAKAGLSARKWLAVLYGELWRVKLPLLIIITLHFIPYLLPGWIFLIVSWSLADFVFKKLAPARQERIRSLFPNIRKSSLFQELDQGISQIAPFVVFSVYIFCAPVAVIWMLCHWISNLRPAKRQEQTAEAQDSNKLLLVQNKAIAESEQESNFFHSPVFGITTMVFFCSGLPAILSYFLYFHFGIDALLGSPSKEPQFFKVFFVICLYIYGIGWSLAQLLLRNWFTFPTNFLSDERVVELNETCIKRHAAKGWFGTVLTMNRPWEGTELIRWEDAVRLNYDQGSGMRFYPLPETIFPGNSLIYKLLNKFAAFSDGVIDRIGRADFVEVKSKDGSSIKLNLWELNGNERARLFYAIRKWAPHVLSDERIQEKLLGSTVLAEPRYTQIWFDLLGSSEKRQRLSSLQQGDKLRDGKILIQQRLGTGGQATVYSAELDSGAQCVLKEFVLSSADTVGALIESAADFDNEAGLLSRLSHPGIVKLIDVFTEDRRLYLVLEKVQGRSLRQVINEDGPLTEDSVRSIGLQVCGILKYLHELEPPLVHRDITPDNLVLSEDGKVTLIDFSLANRAHSKVAPSNSQTTTMSTRSGCVGKFGYTPPEQFREQVLTQSDIYALGSTLHFLLIGKDPKPLTQSSPQSIRPEISDELDCAIRRATDLDLSTRYETVDWIAIDLKRVETNRSNDLSEEAASVLN